MVLNFVCPQACYEKLSNIHFMKSMKFYNEYKWPIFRICTHCNETHIIIEAKSLDITNQQSCKINKTTKDQSDNRTTSRHHPGMLHQDGKCLTTSVGLQIDGRVAGRSSLASQPLCSSSEGAGLRD